MSHGFEMFSFVPLLEKNKIKQTQTEIVVQMHLDGACRKSSPDRSEKGM